MILRATQGQKEIHINGHDVSLPAEIQETLVHKDILFVLLNPESSRRNIFAYSSSGDLLWQIQELPYSQSTSGYRMLDEKQGQIYAISMSTYFKIDIKTGAVFQSTIEK